MKKYLGRIASALAVSALSACAPNGATPSKKPAVVVLQLNSGQEYVHRGFIIPRMDLSKFSAGVELVADGDPTNICRSESDFVMVEPNIGQGVIVCPRIGIRTNVRLTPYPSNSGTMAGAVHDARGVIVGRYSMSWGSKVN